MNIFLLLHLMLLLYSMGGVFSKLASGYPFFSLPFCLCYACVAGILFVYAIGWQQVIKRIPLTTAYANKAVTVAWGMLWGTIFFQEALTVGKLVGAGLVAAGVVLFAASDREVTHE